MGSGPGGVGRAVIKTQRGLLLEFSGQKWQTPPVTQQHSGTEKAQRGFQGASFRRAASWLSAQSEEVGVQVRWERVGTLLWMPGCRGWATLDIPVPPPAHVVS